MTITHGLMYSLPQELLWQQLSPGNTDYCVFLDNGGMYEHQTLHKFVHCLYGCHGNIIMLPLQSSNMFVTSRKWPRAINHVFTQPLPLL